MNTILIRHKLTRSLTQSQQTTHPSVMAKIRINRSFPRLFDMFWSRKIRFPQSQTQDPGNRRNRLVKLTNQRNFNPIEIFIKPFR